MRKNWLKKVMIFEIMFLIIGISFLQPVVDGLNNNPPEKPYIEGHIDGVPNTWYEFRLSSVDPDGDHVIIFVDWGDGLINITQAASSEIKFLYHCWYISDDYTIKAKATDEHGAESEWATSPMHIPCSYNKPLPQFLEKLFQRFPNALPFLQQKIEN